MRGCCPHGVRPRGWGAPHLRPSVCGVPAVCGAWGISTLHVRVCGCVWVSVSRVPPQPPALPALSPGRGARAGGGAAVPRSRPGLCSPSAWLPSFICRLPLPFPRRPPGQLRCPPGVSRPERLPTPPTWKEQKEKINKKKSRIPALRVAPPASRLALLLRGGRAGRFPESLGARLCRAYGHD